MNRTRMRGDTRRIVNIVALSSALLLSALGLAGLGHEPGHLYALRITHLFGETTLYGYRSSLLGYVVMLTALAYAAAAGLLFLISARADRTALTFYLLAMAVVISLGVHDMLVAASLLRSVFYAEYAAFFVSMFVLFGFLREYDTSRKKLRASALALKHASQQLKAATAESRQLRPMADLGKVSASLAHEIRNPLAVLKNVASSLRLIKVEDRGSEQYESLITMLNEEVERLARLVDDLLLYSQTGRTGKETVEPAELVKAAISDAVNLLGPDTEIKINSRIDNDLKTFVGSPDSLRRALFNLINNAVQCSGESGVVEVIARRDESSPDMLMIGVEDSAGGVPEELVDAIFEPFYSTRQSGTGLGLPIARSIVEAHGGRIMLQNRPGRGAVFWMHIPTSEALRARIAELEKRAGLH